LVGTSTTPPFSISFNTATATDGTHSLVARGSSKTASLSSAAVSFRIDNNPPTVPSGFTAVASSTQATLSWSPSSDSVTGVAGYRIYRDGVNIGTTTAT